MEGRFDFHANSGKCIVHDEYVHSVACNAKCYFPGFLATG